MEPLRASRQMFISPSSIQPSTTAQTCCRDSQKSAKWQKGSSNQVAARPMYSCSGLLLHPRCRRCSVSLVSHSLSFFYLMVTVFKDFCLVEIAAWDRCPFVKQTYFWNVNIVSCIGTQENIMIWFINTIFGKFMTFTLSPTPDDLALMALAMFFGHFVKKFHKTVTTIEVPLNRIMEILQSMV